MKFVHHASRASLEALQRELDREAASSGIELGIINIWGEPDAIYIGLEDEGMMVGVATLDCFAEGICSFHKLYVAPSNRQARSGRDLVAEALKLAERTGLKLVGVQVTGNSGRFWRACAQAHGGDDDDFPIIEFALPRQWRRGFEQH